MINEASAESVKLKVTELRPNMVIAKDAFTPNGVLVLAKNTMLNKVNYTKLISNGVTYVNVLKDSVDRRMPLLTGATNVLEEQMKPIKEKQEFIEFETKYVESLDKTKEFLCNIGDGAKINKDDLYSLVNETIDMIDCKSDLFSYFGNLKQTNDPTYQHSINVSILCNLFARWLGMSEQEIQDLTVAGLLHDIGKVKIPKEILEKEGKFTEGEYSVMKMHTLYGYDIVSEREDLSDHIKNAVLMHHEKVNGSGYPYGYTGEKIDNYAKIVAICDIYDAMTSSRSYRDKLCPFKVIEEFELGSFGILDTEYLFVFLQNIAYTYVGSWVVLNDGSTAEVVFINNSNMSRPIVKQGDEFVDLSRNKNRYVESML